ncbi:MAG: energy transducer TonB [Pseudomonadota bacterium]
MPLPKRLCSVLIVALMSLAACCVQQPTASDLIMPTGGHTATAAAEATPPETAYAVTPNPIKTCVPHYPRDAAMSGTEGYVELAFAIDEKGVPHEIRVVGAEPSRIFNASAKSALECWRFPANDPSDNFKVTLEFKLG